jgi:hypothetical protein
MTEVGRIALRARRTWPGMLIAACLTLAHAAGAQCPGDCNRDAAVAVNELVVAVNIALGNEDVATCPPVDRSGDGQVTVNELVAAVTAALNGCPPSDTPTHTPTATFTPLPTETPSPEPTATPPPAATPIPVGADETLAFLQAGGHHGWQMDSESHASAGPHFSTVRTYLNDVLFASLAAGSSSHPVGAAAVNEIVSGDTVRGWAVSVKLQPDSAGGAGWYWFQTFGGAEPQQGVGLTACTTCHAVGSDYVHTELPLR